MSIADSLNRFRGAFRDELADVRAGLSDQGGESGVERLGQLQSLDRTGGPTGLGDYLSGRLGGWGGAPSGLDRLGIAGQWSEQERLASDPFAGFKQRHAYAVDWEQQTAREKATAAQVRARGATVDGDWSGPATADDNATLDGAKIDQFIRSKNAASPLIGKGAYILQVANARGVSAPELLALFWKESSLGSTAGPTFNIAGVGGAGNFAGYGSWEQAIDGAAANLATDLYRGKSVQDHIGYWYAGPERYKMWGVKATDAGDGSAPSPNGTVEDYLNNYVGPTYAGLGVPYNQGTAGTRRAGGGATGSLGAITGGQGAIMQEFGSTDYAEANPGVYSFATAMGLRAGQHSGVDIGLTRGTPLYSPVAGTVTIAGNSGFYTDSGGGPGELRIRLDNGDELILGHDSAINVKVGQRVTPGMLVGLSGGSDGDHVHIEYRIRDGSTPSGWRIVDPRGKLGSFVAAPPTTRPATTGRPIRY